MAGCGADDYNSEITDENNSMQEHSPPVNSHSEEYERLSQENGLLKEELDKKTQELNYIYSILNDITSMEDISFEILSEKTKSQPNETVVLVNNATNDKREQIVIKASIIFSDPSYEQVSLWIDQISAKSYIEGNYDPLDTHSGWSGFDSRIGFIDNTSRPPSLILYLGRDDVLELNFGKYIRDN